MKKKLLLALLASLALTTTYADEGMWTLYNLPNAVYETMKQEGYQLPYDKLYNADDAIMKAVVNFSGYCSGVVVSSDGLVFTNHHCGFESIRSHSTVEHDYMLNGFFAKNYEEELPNKGMFVSFMVEQKDVTPQLIEIGLNDISQEKREEFLDSIENVWSKDIRKNDSTLRLELKPFYEGNRYFATTYRDFRDLRLVFAIPHDRHATSLSSASMPTRRPTVLPTIPKTMFLITPSTGPASLTRAIRRGRSQ